MALVADMSFEEDLAAQANAQRKTRAVTFELNGKPYTLELREMIGPDWADLVDRTPARPGVQFDSFYGYNLRALTPMFLKEKATLSSADGPVDMTDENWDQLCKTISGRDFNRFGDAIYALHEVQLEATVEAVKKASGAASRKKSR